MHILYFTSQNSAVQFCVDLVFVFFLLNYRVTHLMLALNTSYPIAVSMKYYVESHYDQVSNNSSSLVISIFKRDVPRESSLIFWSKC